MADGDQLLFGRVQGDVVNVGVVAGFVEDFAGAGMQQRDETFVIAADRDQPVPVRSKRDPFDQPFELRAFVFEDAGFLLPVENFEAGFAFEVIDVANFAHAADGQQLPISGKGDAANAADRMPSGSRIPGVHDGRFEGFQQLPRFRFPQQNLPDAIDGREMLPRR